MSRRRPSFAPLLLALLLPPAAAAPEVAALVARAEPSLAQGHFAEAEADLRQALQRDPRAPRVRELLGQLYLVQGRPDLAETLFTDDRDIAGAPLPLLALHGEANLQRGRFQDLLTGLYPGPYDDRHNAAILAIRGRAFLGRGRYDDARLAFTDALDLAPDSLTARLGLVETLLQQGADAEARGAADAALRRAPDSALARAADGAVNQARGHADGALRATRESLARAPNQYRTRLTEGVLLLERGEAPRALERLQAMADANPEDPLAAYLLGLALARNGDQASARRSLERVQLLLQHIPPALARRHGPVQLLSALTAFDRGEWRQTTALLESYGRNRPDSLALTHLEGVAYLALGDRERGLSRLKSVLQRRPAYRPLLLRLGDTYLDAGQYYDASRYYSRALAGAEDARARIGLAISLMGMGNRARARDQLYLALADAPAGRAGFLLAISLLQEGRYGEAARVAEALLGAAPKSPERLNLLASAKALAGELEPARRFYRRALQQAPDDLLAQANLAKLERLAGDPAAARTRLEALLDRAPDQVAVVTELARVQRQLGDTRAARTLLERSWERHGDSVPLGTLLVDLYLSGGETERALRLARVVAGRDPDSWRAARWLAVVQLAAERPAIARVKLKQLSIMAGYDAGRLLETAHWQLRAGDPAGAIFSLYEALKAGAEAPRVRRWLGELLLSEGRPLEAQDQLDALTQQHPDHPQTRQLQATLEGSALDARRIPAQYRGGLPGFTPATLPLDPLLYAAPQPVSLDTLPERWWLEAAASPPAESASPPPFEAWRLMTGPLAPPRPASAVAVLPSSSFYLLSWLLPPADLGCADAPELWLLCGPRQLGNHSFYRTLGQQGRLRR